MNEIIWETPTIDISHIVTEDDEPVDNLFSAKQQRLLVRSLYADWQIDVPFLADANVGIFPSPHEPPVVPDLFVSLNVRIADDWYAREHRTYFLWEFGKAPEIVLEIVSNRKGGEPAKRQRYARMGIDYYLIYDPQHLIQTDDLRIFRLWRGDYVVQDDRFLDGVGLGLTLWQGEFEQKSGVWLRWVDAAGALLLTGSERAAAERERAEVERERAEVERERAEVERERAEVERERAERLAEKLRALGIDPDQVD